MQIAFHALPTEVVAKIRLTGLDAYGQKVERHVSEGGVYPCRHCLGEIPEGETYLILAHRPFVAQHAFAETGPIFLCEKTCARADPDETLPETLRADQFILRSYDHAERILYGTGKVVPTGAIPDTARAMLADPDVAFVDIRSAANNCYQCRVKRT